MLIVMFFCIGAFFIISQNNLALNSSENVDKFISVYKGWIEGTLENIGSLTAYVIKMDWLPEREI